MRRLAVTSLFLLVSVLASPAPAAADKRGIRVDGKSAEDYVAEQTGKSWAVVIGIDDYESIPQLRYAVADAKAVAQTLRQRGYQVSELYNQRATKDAIEGELTDKLAGRVGEQDRVVIFFSGHGETKTFKGGKPQGYLLPVGAKKEELGRTGIDMGRIRSLADLLPSKHVLFLVDVCYGGIAGTAFKSPKTYDADYLREITRERGRQLITAGGPGQEALEGPEWGHSVFTYYLLEGLNKGLADLDGDGIIPASELHTYLARRVFDAAKDKGHTQRPEMWKLATEPGEFVFFASARASTGLSTGGLGGKVVGVGPSVAVSQAEQELKALEEQERQAEEQKKLAEVQAKIAEKKKKLEVASLPTPSLPRQTGREITGKDGAPMVLVPEGEFLYGDKGWFSDMQRLSLPAFYMDKYEVSTKLYATFIQDTGRVQPDDWSKQVALVGSGDRPVVNVTWHDADTYCRHYGKRLPTEQEWEKSARGTDGRKYPWGNEEPSSQYANYGKNYPSNNFYKDRLTPVGNYEAGKSPYGIYDLAGNVWEWTSSDEGSSKVIRGGAWTHGADWLRSTGRANGSPTLRYSYFGFRCAQDAR